MLYVFRNKGKNKTEETIEEPPRSAIRRGVDAPTAPTPKSQAEPPIKPGVEKINKFITGQLSEQEAQTVRDWYNRMGQGPSLQYQAPVPQKGLHDR